MVATVLRADLAEDCRQFQPGGAHGDASEVRRWRRLGDGFDPGQQIGQLIEGAHGGHEAAGGHLQVSRGGGQAAMTEKQLNAAHVGARLQQMGGECVPQRVRRDGLVDAGGAMRLLAGLLDGFLVM